MLNINRRGFLRGLLAVPAALMLVPAQAMAWKSKLWVNKPNWTLDDLQYCVDYIDQTWGYPVTTIRCSYANRRELLRQHAILERTIQRMNGETVVRIGEVTILASEKLGDSMFIMITDREKPYPAPFYNEQLTFFCNPAKRIVLAEMLSLRSVHPDTTIEWFDAPVGPIPKWGPVIQQRGSPPPRYRT